MIPGDPFARHLRIIWEKVSQAPLDWLFIFFLPVLLGIYLASHEKARARLVPFVKPTVLAASVLTLVAAFRIAVSYLSVNFIINAYSTLFAITSWLFCLGQPVFSSAHAQEPYSMPYGPSGYIVVGCFQHVLGPSIFSSKLAPFLATVGSWIFLYLALRTRVAWLAALALTALATALPLPFDPIQFWPRPDPFLLLSVCGGLWAATRRELWGLILLGFFIGFAINLKLYAIAFFFLPIVVAWRTHQSLGRGILAGLVAVLVALLPFAWPNISLGDYLAVLKLTATTRCMDVLGITYVEWAVMLSILGLSPLLVNQLEAGGARAALRRNCDLLGALLFAFFLVIYPASKEGGGPHHIMPFIPVIIYLAAHLYADISSKSFLQRTWHWIGLSLTLSIVIFAELNACYLGLKAPGLFAPTEALAKAQIADIRQIFQEKSPCLLLNAPGNLATHEEDFYRAILVFNGMPIGIDPAVAMDNKYLEDYEPDLPDFVAGLKSKYHRPIVWICPKGVDPFSWTSYFGYTDKVFSDKFRNDFHRLFQLTGQTACFDIYEEKSN